MILLWRRRRGKKNKKEIPATKNAADEMEVTIPAQFQCPISFDLMKDPVIVSTGITYDRESIERWIDAGNVKCPVTNQVLKSFDQVPNHAIRRMIQDWCVEKGSDVGIERIPTPRVPITPGEVSEICENLSAATQRGDQKKCGEIVGKIKSLGKESERNRKCFRENGAALVLCVCFDAFASTGDENSNAFWLEEILLLLTWMIPFGSEVQAKIASASSLSCIVGFLGCTDYSVRRNAAFLVKELISLDETHVHVLTRIDGVAYAFVKLIRDAICPTATKSSLTAIYHMISNKREIVPRFLETGLVSLAVEMIVDAEKSVSEKAIAVLDAICDSEEGREEVSKNALVMPLLVKKIPKISELATRSSVSVMWKLCKRENADADANSAVEEAVRLGAFQKLLVVLQVGCGEGTKEKVTELLKMMNAQKGKMGNDDCVDSSMEYKYIKRPF